MNPWKREDPAGGPAIAAESPNSPIFMSEVRAPAAAANGSASRIASSTG